MVKRKSRSRQRAARVRPRKGHVYPADWRPDDWVVPFRDGYACMHHGPHTAPDDHSLCGPAIFCCQKSAEMYVSLYPDSEEAKANWELVPAEHIATWLDAGVNVIYYFFCDPERADGLLVVGVGGPGTRDVLFKEEPLEALLGEARRLR